MSKPRKRYRHDPGKKYEHPLLRKAEAAGLAKWRSEHFAMMDSYEDCSVQKHMIVTLADTIAVAFKSMQDWDDPDQVGLVMAEAIGALAEMGEAGFTWRAADVPILKDAVNIATQVINGMPVLETAKAQAWAKTVHLIPD